MATIPAPSSTKARASAIATTSSSKDATPSFGIMWSIMRSIGDMSLPFFFSSVHVSNSHLVPSSNTPLIVCSNHSNTILDVAILASHFPERRPLHFWAKAGFFKNRITRFILTSSGNIKVDRRNKNNQALFEGTFDAMKAGGAIALFPEGGSYTIPNLAPLKMGAAWAALEYSRYLQLQGEGEEGKAKGKPRTEVKILPSAVVFDDKSVFRSRAVLRFGQPISLDNYIEEFLSSPPPSDEVTAEKKGATTGVGKEDGTVPATPESMTRSNTSDGAKEYASPAHRAVARLTADLQKAIEGLTFNAPNWETFQAVRLARELTFELTSDGKDVVKEGMNEYVELSRALMALLTLDGNASEDVQDGLKEKSKCARQSLFAYSCLLHLCSTENLTLAHITQTPTKSPFFSPLRSLLLRLPLYLPIYGLSLIPTYILPNKLAHHFAGREEESLSSVKTLLSFFFTTILYSGLLVKTMQWARWSPPGLLVGLAGIWWMHDLGRSNVDAAYGWVKRCVVGWRMWCAGVRPVASSSSSAGVFKGWSRLPQNQIQKHTSLGTTAEPGEVEDGKSLFFYGTLVHPRILSRVIGNDGPHLRIQNAVLDGAQLYHVRGQEYPGLLRVPSSRSSINAVKGTLVSGLTRSDLACLDAFEGDEYTRLLISVIPDPSSAVESNSVRIANAGGAPLHSILAGLTPQRIAELCTTEKGGKKVEAEVYSWTAGKDKLLDTVWQFDVFAQNHAGNWVGDGEVEHEHEYQVVDKVRTDLTSTSTLTSTPPNAPSTLTGEREEKEWVGSYANGLTQDEKTKEAIEKVIRMLSEKPSIQFYVDKAFPRAEALRRPKLGDRELLRALLAARSRARDAWQDLLVAVDDVEEVNEAVEFVIGAKVRALRRIGAEAASDEVARWPFTSTQLQLATSSFAESRKTV
ncbi:uncharacterized protein UTRI_05827 [Ustilago trichophora]|uniref:Phospholipid/glycerol acyltransferase domain-containing protein n=1 Tax=Ustilago trichophora TaxID=86804 RepID=A0A5C3EIE2_9BASI|nr:uncharacterized protein UTRI_05827 [Ustilago trichophora]